jgi:hypothetical protein
LNILDSERIITVRIVIVTGIFGIFGGLAGGSILSLADFYAPRERRLGIFIIPKFMGFGCHYYYGNLGQIKKKKIENMNQREMTTRSMIKSQDVDSKNGIGPRSDIVAERA